MLVKNTMTGVKIEKRDAYILETKSKKCFFDSYEQCMEYLKNKELKKTLGQDYINLIEEFIDLSFNKNLYPRIRRDIKLFMEKFDYAYIHSTIETAKKDMKYAHETKHFTTPSGKYGYLSKIFSNSLVMNKASYDQAKATQKVSNNVSSDIMEIVKDNKGFEKASITKYIKEDF